MRNADHDHTTPEAARRATLMRDAMGPGYGFGGPSEAILGFTVRSAARVGHGPRPGD